VCILTCGFIQVYKNIFYSKIRSKIVKNQTKIVLISHSPLVQGLKIVVLFSCNASAVRQYDTLRRTKSGK